MPRLSIVVMALALTELLGCANAPPPAATTASAPRRRRARRPRPAPAVDVVTATPAPASTAAPAPAAAPAAPPAAPSTVLGITLPRTAAPSTPSTAFGSPVVQGDARSSLVPRWVTGGEHPHVRCEGDATAQVPAMQSPWEPSNAMLVRAFFPVTNSTLACNPPADPHGRFVVRAQFSGGGLPQEFSFPGATRISATRARCLGAALCSTRMPAFRAGNAILHYSFVVPPVGP